MKWKVPIDATAIAMGHLIIEADTADEAAKKAETGPYGMDDINDFAVHTIQEISADPSEVEEYED